MAQIINISNSVDSRTMLVSTIPNDDEDDGDEHRQLLGSPQNMKSIPIAATTSTTTDIVIPLPDFVGLLGNQNDSSLNEISSCTNQTQTNSDLMTSVVSPSDALNQSPISDNESNSNEPLLAEVLPSTHVYTANLYAEDERTSASNSSTISSSSTIIRDRGLMINYFNDMFISAFLITPLLNIHWRGAWDIFDIYLLPDYPYTSASISLGIGLVMLCIIYLSQGYCQTFYEKHRYDLLGKIMTRFHTIMLAFAYIQQWRGIWNLMDLTNNSWYYLLAETLACVIVLIMMGDVYNLNSAPFLIGVDTESYFLIDSKITISKRKYFQRLLDFIFYEVLEAPMLIIAWHGLYNLSDSYIFPDNKELSTIVSFSSGYALYFVLAMMQIPVLQCLIKYGGSWTYTCVANIFHLLAFLSVVQIWRSLWLICEQYLNIPDYHDLTLGLCYGGALLVLICGLTVCSLNGPAGSKESCIDDEMAPFFQFDYLSTMLRHSKSSFKDKTSNILSSDILSSATITPTDYSYGFQPP